METANAFNLLILPMFQCTAGILAFFAMIRLIQIALDDRITSTRSSEPVPPRRGSAVVFRLRPVAIRADRGRTTALNVSR
jgi:hypothetical protein